MESSLLVEELEQCAQDRTGWRALTRRQALVSFEEQSRAGLITARERKKAAAAAMPAEPRQFPCPN